MTRDELKGDRKELLALVAALDRGLAHDRRELRREEEPALNDLAKVRASAEELLRISKAARFRKALNTAKSEYHANNFQRAAGAAIEKAKAKNIDGATLAYLDLTMTCVRCHQHTREEGIGLAAPARGDAIGRWCCPSGRHSGKRPKS